MEALITMEGKWLRRAARHLLVALRYLWWALRGSPEQRRDQWRRESEDHFSLETVRAVEREDHRRCAEREALPFEKRPMVRNARRAGWWSTR